MPFIKFSGISEDLQWALDVGCGTGSLAFALGEVAPRARITGLDYSQAFVDCARSRADSGRFSFDQGDAVSLPYEAASFDATMSMLVLSFLSEPERAVREMVRVTRPGGVVAAAVWDFLGGHTFSRILLDTAAPLDPGAVDLRAQHCRCLLAQASWRPCGNWLGCAMSSIPRLPFVWTSTHSATYGNRGSADKVLWGLIWSGSMMKSGG